MAVYHCRCYVTGWETHLSMPNERRVEEDVKDRLRLLGNWASVARVSRNLAAQSRRGLKTTEPYSTPKYPSEGHRKRERLGGLPLSLSFNRGEFRGGHKARREIPPLAFF